MRKKFKDCVRPGVEDVRAKPWTLSREFIKLDFPTFERPMKATSNRESRGQSASVKALLINSVLETFISVSEKFASLMEAGVATSGARNFGGSQAQACGAVATAAAA